MDKITILNRQNVEFSTILDEKVLILVDNLTNNGGKLIQNYINQNIVNNYMGTRKIVKGNINNSILLYNSNEWVYYPTSFDYDTNSNTSGIVGKLSLRDYEDTYYKVNPVLYRTSFTGSTILISGFNSSTHSIFKVFRNGQEVTNYTVNSNGITFSNSNVFSNFCEVIYYPTTQDLSGKSFELYYYTVGVKASE